MKVLLIKLVFLVVLGTPDTNSTSCEHSENSGNTNLATLKQIENLITKKAGAEFQESNENSFVLNGYDVYTEVKKSKFGPSVFEESFFEIENPENIYRMRIIKDINGDIEFAVLINGQEGIVNYHAVFDSNGNMLPEDPWGNNEGYTIEIFNLYNKYRKIYAERVDAIR